MKFSLDVLTIRLKLAEESANLKTDHNSTVRKRKTRNKIYIK